MKAKTNWNLQNAIVVIQTLASIPKDRMESVEHLQQVQEVLRLSGIKSHLYAAGFVPHRPELYFLDCAGELWNDLGKEAIKTFQQKSKHHAEHPLKFKKISPPNSVVLKTEYEPYIQTKLQQTPLISFYKKNLIIKTKPFLFQIPNELIPYITEVKNNLPSDYSILKPNQVNLIEKEYFELRLDRIKRIIESQNQSYMKTLLREQCALLLHYIPNLFTKENTPLSFIIGASKISPAKDFCFNIHAPSIEDEKKLITFLNFDLIFRTINQETTNPFLLFQQHQFILINAEKQQNRTFTPIDRNHPLYLKDSDQFSVLEAFHKIKDELDIQKKLQTKNTSSIPKVRF